MMSSPNELHGLSRGQASTIATTTTVTAPPVRWKSRVLLPGLILLTIAALLLITSAQTLLPATSVRVVPVVVKTVAGTAGSVTVQAPGWLEPDPHPYYVAALADGVVAEVLVLEGEPVAPDQVVAQLVDDDARLALARAEAELMEKRAKARAAEADLDAARLQLEHLIERSRARDAADAKVAEAQAEVARVEASVAVAEARRLEVQDEYDRKSQLTASQAVSEATVARLRLQVDAQSAVVREAVALAAVAEAKLAHAEAGQRAATTARRLLIDERHDVALADAAVQSAAAAVALAEAGRDEAALRLDRMKVRSAVGGVVLQRFASPGSKVTQNGGEHSSHVIHVYDPERLQVRVDVPLADAAHVSVGQHAEVTVEVLPDHTFSGSVTRVVHEADLQKNTVELKVAVDDPTPDLKPEMLARVRFLAQTPTTTGAIRQRMFAPSGLVRESGDGGAVALVVTDLVDQRGRVERRSVTLGNGRLDGWVEIEGGLRVGDMLVADPGDLEDGARVRVVGEEAPGGGS